MPATLVHDNPGSDLSGRSNTRGLVHQLSDGSWIVIAPSSANNTLLIHRTTDRTTWSLRSTLAVDTILSGADNFVVAVDSANNIHCLWVQNTTFHVRYCKLTYNATGPVWTAGAAETVWTKQANQDAEFLAIECLDSGVILAAYNIYHSSEFSAIVDGHARVRHTGGAWGTDTAIPVNSSTADAGSTACNVARDAGGASGGVQKVLHQASGGFGSPWITWVYSVTLATGAIGSLIQVDPNNWPVYPADYRATGQIFSHAAGVWRAMSYTSIGGVGSLGAVEIDSTGAVTKSASISTKFFPTDSFPQLGKMTFMYLPDRLVMVGNSSGSATMEFQSAVYRDGAIFFTPSVHIEDTGLPTGASFYFVGGDANRNINDQEHLLGVWRSASFDDLYCTYLAAPPQTPTTVVPASGATVTTDIPTLSANLARGANLQYTSQWQIAQDSGFTTQLKTVTEPEADYKATDSYAEVVPTASQLSQTTWYIRARARDVLGQTGAWTTAHTFTVTHPPSASVSSPTGDITREFGTGVVTFEWGYSDTSPVDAQTAYQIIVERNSDGLAVADSGKVVAAGFPPNNAYGVPTVGRGNLAIPGAYKDVTLRWKVRVWDSDDVAGSYSSYGLFKVADAPGIAITTPADAAELDNPQPLFVWDFTGPAGRTQTQFRVLIKTAAGATVHDSGNVAGAVESYQLPQALLQNLGSYTVQVTVTDNLGLTNSDTNAFTTEWTPPDVPTDIGVNVLNFDTDGFTSIFWDSSVRDVDFYAWRVYRRVQGDTSFVLLHETTTPDDMLYEDWSAQSGVTYEYNVVQVANRFGSLMESEHTWQAPVTPESSHYWLLHPDDNNKNIKLFHVISEDFTEEYESATLNLIGRGRHTDYGTRYGYSGTVVCEIRNYDGKTARQIKQEIEGIKAEKRELYLRNPFGDLWLVSLGDLATSRLAGTGTNEYCTVTIPYQEVS